MNLWTIVNRGLAHFWRNHLALALGAAIATAVLTGALLIGDSMRMSLTELTLDRLGKIDEILVSDGFFATQLATKTKTNSESGMATPLILFPGGTVETTIDDSLSRASSVNVMGIGESFWDFDASGFRPDNPLGENGVIINQTLARDLGIEPNEWDQIADTARTLTLRIPKPVQLPSESALGVTTDLIESIVDLKIQQVIADKGLGRFSLQPSQVTSPNLFIDIGRLQERLARKTLKHKSTSEQCNAVLFSGLLDDTNNTSTANVLDTVHPTLEDLGITLKRVTEQFGEEPQPVFDYWSLSSDRMVIGDSIARAVTQEFPQAQPVMTYLANDIRRAGEESGIPFSMVSAVEIGDAFALTDVDGKRIAALGDDEIVLNQWSADDLGVKVGDEIEMTYFEPETTHGNQIEQTAKLRLVAIAGLTEPETPMRIKRRGGGVTPAVYTERPTVANDPDLTPSVPGVTDAASIENWDLPFATADRIRPVDDDYWTDFRTTPKAFISLKRGHVLWKSRFGSTTSFRIPADAGSKDSIADQLLQRFVDDQTDVGMRLIPIRKNGLAASSGSTPFDGLFLALSMFVIASALILVTLLFRLSMQNRAAEIGVLQAVGLPQKEVSRLWLREMGIVCLIGAVIGVLLGIGYAWLMVYGLRTWWIGAISTPFIELFITLKSLLIGLLSGLLVCVLTVWWSLRSARNVPVRQLLSGRLENSASSNPQTKSSRWQKLLSNRYGIGVLFIAAAGLAIVATQLSGEPQAGAFMGAGFLVLTASLWSVYRWLKDPRSDSTMSDLAGLAKESAKRSPLRSALTVGLIGVASFLIVAVSSFRLSPTQRGTAGFDYIASTSQPLIEDLNTAKGRSKLLGDVKIPDSVRTWPLRLKPGQDASCNNLYQSTQPQVLGVPQSLITRLDDRENRFEWAGTFSEINVGVQNPWRQLEGGGSRPAADPIPVIIDKNTANYSLKIFALGTRYDVEFDSGEKVTFEVVGFLSNTLLQGSLIIGEEDFKRVFPAVAGYRFFLIDTNAENTSSANAVASLEKQLGDYGFDAQRSDVVLERFMAVQNTYLSTFQTLGGLGLLLGTFGMAILQIRNVIERTGELAVMRAIGFDRSRISGLVFRETAWLMLLGLGVGVGSALFTTLPHYFSGGASLPWLTLIVIFSIVLLFGMLASYIAARLIQRQPLLDALRQ